MYIYIYSVLLLPLSAGAGRDGSFSKKEELDWASTLRRELLGKRGVTFFRGEGCNFHIKSKSKSEIFNDGNSL